jgi:hypothetical protein
VWLSSKKQPPIKTDEIYQAIVSAVEQRANGERFNDDKACYNYGSK